MEGVVMSAEVFTGVRFAGRHWEPEFYIAHYVDGEVLCLDCAVDCQCGCGEIKEGLPTTVQEIADGFIDAKGSAFPHRWGCEDCGSSLFDHFVRGLDVFPDSSVTTTDLLGTGELFTDLLGRFGIDVGLFDHDGIGIAETTLTVGDGVANRWRETFTGTTDEGRSVSSLSLALLRLAVTVHCADNDGDVGFVDDVAGFTLSALAFLERAAK